MTKITWANLPQAKRAALTKLLDRAFEEDRHVGYAELFDAMARIMDDEPLPPLSTDRSDAEIETSVRKAWP